LRESVTGLAAMWRLSGGVSCDSLNRRSASQSLLSRKHPASMCNRRRGVFIGVKRNLSALLWHAAALTARLASAPPWPMQ